MHRLLRASQVLLATLLSIMVALCVIGSTVLVFQPPAQLPVIGVALGILMLVIGLWLAALCVRLLRGNGHPAGILTPQALRLMGWLLLAGQLLGVFIQWVSDDALDPAQIGLIALGYLGVWCAFRGLAPAAER